MVYRIGDTKSSSSTLCCYENNPTVAVRTNVYLAMVMKTTSLLCKKHRCLCNGFTHHIAPSLRLFIPNSLTVYHLSFLSRAMLVTYAVGLAVLSVACLFFSLWWCLSNHYHWSLLKGAHHEQLPCKVPVYRGALSS
jgi:hypothetical protein